MTDLTDLVDLAAERLGGAVLAANDEFFAPKEALLRPNPPEWREGAYTERGKWMDGWETRRRRTPGHDWCIVRLGLPGVIRGIVVDTSFFRGNYPEGCSLDATELAGVPDASTIGSDPAVEWVQLLELSRLLGDSRIVFPVHDARRFTHVRLNIFPDGGVARLRVHGEARPEPHVLRAGRELDLAAMENGGVVLECSDMFFGHRHNLILPGRSTHMGDGWETKRRRGPGHDWIIVRLAARGLIEAVEVDTDHFRGNAPESCSMEACDVPSGGPAAVEDAAWTELLARTRLQPHSRHRFAELATRGPFTHVRLNIYPDGGVARLRLPGTIVAAAAEAAGGE